MMTVPEYFGCKAFDDRVMKARLSQPVYESLRKTMDEGPSSICPWPMRWPRL